MTTLNCAAKLARRLPLSLVEVPLPSTNALGPWCANTFNIGRFPYLIITNEKTLLTVLLPFKEIHTIVPRFLQSLKSLLTSLNISSSHIKREVEQMHDIQFTQRTNRQTLGSMNDFVHLLKAQLDQGDRQSLDELSVFLSEVPCSPLKMESPKNAVVRIFSDTDQLC